MWPTSSCSIMNRRLEGGPSLTSTSNAAIRGFKACCVQSFVFSSPVPTFLTFTVLFVSRKYHVSKLVVTPHWKTAVMHKRLKGLSKNFHIELMDGKTSWFLSIKKLIMLGTFMTTTSSSSSYVLDSWIKPASSHVYQLASQINFQVSAFYIPPGAKVYISSCFAAPAHSSGSALKHIVIDNSG